MATDDFNIPLPLRNWRSSTPPPTTNETKEGTVNDGTRDMTEEPKAVEEQEDIGTLEDLNGDGIPDDLDDEGLDDLLVGIDPDDIETPNDDEEDD